VMVFIALEWPKYQESAVERGALGDFLSRSNYSAEISFQFPCLEKLTQPD